MGALVGVTSATSWTDRLMVSWNTDVGLDGTALEGALVESILASTGVVLAAATVYVGFGSAVVDAGVIVW